MAETPVEGIEAVDNGTCRFWLDRNFQTIRRPKLGELRHFEETLAEVEVERQEHFEAKLAERAAEIEALRWPEGSEPTKEEAAERRLQIDRLSKRIVRDAERGRDEHLIRWLRDTLTALGAKFPDSDDDLPAWAVDPKLPSRLFSLWRTVPFRSVARN